LSFGQPITKAFSAAMLSLTAVLIILLLLIGLTVSALPHNVRFSDASISQLNGVPVFSAQAVIGNPGPLPLEHSSAGLSFSASPNFRAVALSQTASVGVGGNITLPVNLSIHPSRPAACELLFHGEEVSAWVLPQHKCGWYTPHLRGVLYEHKLRSTPRRTHG